MRGDRTAPRRTGTPERAATAKAPDAFRTISEVAEELSLPSHVLRFWETRFAQVRPVKRSGGRRLDRPEHVALLRGIRALLYDDGMTIKGVQKMLRVEGSRAVIARGRADAALSLASVPADAAERLAGLRERLAASAPPPGPRRLSPERRRRLEVHRDRLAALLARLEGADAPLAPGRAGR
jgi:DNA-binding transcriptional MerR regulator